MSLLLYMSKLLWIFKNLEVSPRGPGEKDTTKLSYLVLFIFVCMDAFRMEGSGYPKRDFASRPGTEQTFLLP